MRLLWGGGVSSPAKRYWPPECMVHVAVSHSIRRLYERPFFSGIILAGFLFKTACPISPSGHGTIQILDGCRNVPKDFSK